VQSGPLIVMRSSLSHHFLFLYNRCGPLVRYWCMRFEGKHNYFKDLAHRVKCFKNIAKTLATRHQHLMCYYLGTSTPGSPFCKDAMVGPVSTKILSSLPFKEEVIRVFPNCHDESLVTRYKDNNNYYFCGHNYMKYLYCF